jgi:hypothetical protein
LQSFSRRGYIEARIGASLRVQRISSLMLMSATHPTIPDLLRNILPLMDAASFIDLNRDRSAFLNFAYRREIDDARFASSLLHIVAEPQFCATLVHRCPWDTAAMLNRIGTRELISRAATPFVQEIGRQAILCPSSMLGREIGYKGFDAAPILSQSLFGDPFINRYYQPLAGLNFGDFKNIDPDMLERFMEALRATLTTALDAGEYWDDRSLAMMAQHIGGVAIDVHRQIRADIQKYPLVSKLHTSMEHIIFAVNRHLDGLDETTCNKLYIGTQTK